MATGWRHIAACEQQAGGRVGVDLDSRPHAGRGAKRQRRRGGEAGDVRVAQSRAVPTAHREAVTAANVPQVHLLNKKMDFVF